MVGIVCDQGASICVSGRAGHAERSSQRGAPRVPEYVDQATCHAHRYMQFLFEMWGLVPRLYAS